jgi:hypothetical protein
VAATSTRGNFNEVLQITARRTPEVSSGSQELQRTSMQQKSLCADVLMMSAGLLNYQEERVFFSRADGLVKKIRCRKNLLSCSIAGAFVSLKTPRSKRAFYEPHTGYKGSFYRCILVSFYISSYLLHTREISSIYWAQLSRLPPEDGSRI